MNSGIEQAKEAFRQTPWGKVSQNISDIANKVPEVQHMKAKASNWLSVRTGFKIKL